MTTIEATIEEVKKINDFRKVELSIGSPVIIKGIEEIVIGTTITETCNEKKLERFRTIRRQEDGSISELSYNVNGSDGVEHLYSSGIFYGEEHLPYHSSERFHELNQFLLKLGK